MCGVPTSAGALAGVAQTARVQRCSHRPWRYERRPSSYLRMLVPPGAHRSPVPAGAYNVGAQLLAIEAGIEPNPASARAHLAGGLWLTLRAARPGEAGSQSEWDIAVTIEDSSPAQRADMFARAHALSPREGELLGLLVTGHDTRELARLMLLSEHTVQHHLKSIFAKTSTHSRRTLVSRTLGT